MNVIVLFACMYMCLVESHCCCRLMPTAMQAIFFITAFGDAFEQDQYH